jgi:VanZ family protein
VRTSGGGGPRAAADLLSLWGPVAAWMAFLFALSDQAVVTEVAGLPDWVTHGGGFGMLCVLLCRALGRGLTRPVPMRVAMLAIAITFLYGITDEIHQSFVPGRHPDPWDLLKNLGGAIAGAIVCAVPRPARDQRKAA